MNERIRELIFDAVTFRIDPDSECYEAQVCPEDLEYLVELIVRECALVVHKKTGPKSALNVLEHFGVEE